MAKALGFLKGTDLPACVLPRVTMTPSRGLEGTESACLSERQHTPGALEKALENAVFWVCNGACDSWSGVSTSCIYNVRENDDLPTHALPRKGPTRSPVGWLQHL